MYPITTVTPTMRATTAATDTILNNDTIDAYHRGLS